MSTPSSTSSSQKVIRSRIETIVALAGLLQRVEARTTPIDPGQYRLLVGQLTAALREEIPGEVLNAILTAYPAAAEVYENLHYEHAGLSRAPLERSVASEQLAAQVIARAAGRAPRAES